MTYAFRKITFFQETIFHMKKNQTRVDMQTESVLASSTCSLELTPIKTDRRLMMSKSRQRWPQTDRILSKND